MDEQERLEELKKLETLHKKALAKRVTALHRSTKTLIKPLETVHFGLRDKFRWYYKWHTSKVSTFVHWSIFILAILTLFYLSWSVREAVKYKNSIPQKQLIVLGPVIGGDKISFEKEKTNIKLEKSKIELDDKKITIGVIKKKANLEEIVSWKNIEWSADIPEGTSIVYRTRVSDEDREETWEKALWSSYYPISSGSNTQNKGIPLFKGRYVEAEIVLEGNNKEETPTLNYLKFGYAPFRENKIVAFLKDKLISGLARIFRFLEKREGIQ